MKNENSTGKMSKITWKKIGKNRHRRLIIGGSITCGLLLLFNLSDSDATRKISAENSQTAMETALYTREEFFGASAVVPLPTKQARENLAAIAAAQPDDWQIIEKLAELDEKLSDFDAAEKLLIRAAETDGAKLENLADFYERRARFEKEAEILQKILTNAAPEKRGKAFENLVAFARRHDLQNYLQTEFYAATAKENPDVYEIFEQTADTLTEQKNYDEALNFVRQAKAQFPARRGVLLVKEIEILRETDREQEAETVYQQAFDPLWSADEADNFYEFLSDHERLRAYGAEMKAKFIKNPADFDAAIRYALYRNHDNSYGNDELTPIILKLERAKKDWTTEELMTVSRILLRANEAETASRFLYTLYLREDFTKNGERRAKILYQLFEMFSDAETQKLPLTGGDLSFYEDVAKTDTSPGIATGILSLIFSDTHPQMKLEAQEIKANKYFNRAAAYRIFLEYKKEFSTSPELAQMYLDIVRLYTATKETKIAAETLSEFEQRYQNSTEFAPVALKLADAFAAADEIEKSREVYRQILEFQGRQNAPLRAPTKREKKVDGGESKIEIPPDPNDGINIPKAAAPPTNEYEYRETGSFHDYLDRKNAPVIYSDVLAKLVASLAAENKTAEILELYSVEIARHPDEQWLYEQRLDWLEQTNLTDEQLVVYQAALARFQSRGWQDKLARWLVREKRNAEFAEFSEELVGKLNDAETQNYLSQFIDGKISSLDFDKRLYLKLYEAAHTRFPHNPAFVQGLLRFYKTNKQPDDWRKLAAEHFFESKVVRGQFLDQLTEKNELRGFLARANGETEVYQLFRADAEARLSNFENAVEAYRKLNEIYPNSTDFSERLIALTRSFGQKNRAMLAESGTLAQANADFVNSSAELRTRSGEIYAELGDYRKSVQEWEKLIATAAGDKEIYLETATLYWDYFQYDDALRTIEKLRRKYSDNSLYAFEAGAVYESRQKENEAVAEYVKTFGASDDESRKEQALNRLVFLFKRETNRANDKNYAANVFVGKVNAAYSNEAGQRRDASFLTLGFAEFLSQTVGMDRAEILLNRAVADSKNVEFIEAARDFYQSNDDQAGEQTALKRLAAAAESPRRSIGYRFQLAESFEADKQRDSAKRVLNELVTQYSTNYGVLSEAANFYDRLGFENEAAAVLQNALPRSRGQYRRVLAQKLAARLIRLDRLDSAREILGRLHDEDAADTEIFDQLANVCVRLGDAAALRKAFGETVDALKLSTTKRRELDAEIADLRGRMIDAFTKLEDYNSAVAQHIEIINREPQNEELTDNAIRYVQRYGGAETLLKFYLKTSAEAFKNYRWNVVLARIYEAGNDSKNAAENYAAAIVNQPEMPELYAALADVNLKTNDFDEALKNLDEVLRLTNDAPEYVKKKIEILKKTGRAAEIEAEQAKLPPTLKPSIASDEFAEAKKAQNTEEARELYRAAFAKLLENPLNGDFKTADVAGYVQSVREVEPLDKINATFWILREKLAEKAVEPDSTHAGEAKKRLSILDNALIEMIGGIAKTIGTDAERAALHEDLNMRISEYPATQISEYPKILALIQDISRRAGFGDLEETIWRKKIESANSAGDKQIYLRSLTEFYDERGAYQKTFDALEKYGTDDFALKAEAARMIDNRAKELEALRAIYWNSDQINPANDPNVGRYLEILLAENREELKTLTEKNAAFQLQLINFLLGKGERELAHSAIENSNRSAAWKVSRHAETSLALKEFGETAECYFCDALQFDTIGNLVNQNPDKKRFLINDDWFRLSREYGEWLDENPSKTIAPPTFLTALIENQPQNDERQVELGEYYLEKKDLKRAVEHLRLAVELKPENKKAWANLGAAYYLTDKKDWARESWAKVLADNDLESVSMLVQILRKNSLAAQAQEISMPLIVDYLENSNADSAPEMQNLIRKLAESFTGDDEKSAYFRGILKQRPTDVSLAAMLINENLIGKNRQNEFYESLIERSEKTSGEDYSFTNAARKTWTQTDAESVYEQENDYQIEEPKNERFEHQKNYLALLIEHGETLKAQQLIAEIGKELKNRYALPPEIKLAKIRLKTRAGQFDFAEAEQFIGIKVSDSATEIHPPNIERFDSILRILKDEKKQSEAGKISESFYARMLALGQFGTANFAGLARVYCERNETAKGLEILRLAVNASGETERETASAEIGAIEIIKAKSADAVKFAEAETNDAADESAMLRTAAEIAAEFGQTDAAVNFRRQLSAVNPTDFENRLELAKTLAVSGQQAEAANLLTQIINNHDALRATRWRARTILSEHGGNAEAEQAQFDAFGQFENGLKAAKNGQNELAENYFINSLTAENDAELWARQGLIKLYAAANMNRAALKIAESDKSAKSDELLQILSETAEKVGEFGRAMEFEKFKSSVNQERIGQLQQKNDDQNRRATNLTVDAENTRKL